MDDIRGSEARLFQARGIEVIAAADPQDRRSGAAGFARGDAGKEQGSGRVIDQRAGQCGRFMQGAGAQTTGPEACIDRLDAERHDSMIDKRGRQRAKGIDALVHERRGW